MGTLWQDIRYGLRMLARNPGFTTVAVLTLVLGVGTNSAIFSVVYSVLLRPLPFRDSDRLVWFWETNVHDRRSQMGVSFPTFLDWREQQHSFETLACFQQESLVLSDQGEPERIPAAAVSAEFFSVLGLSPRLGRDFHPDEDRVSGRPVALLGYELWRSHFGSDPGVVGRGLTLDGKSYEILGVAAPGGDLLVEAQVWIPLIPRMAQALTVRGAHICSVVGRLRREVPLPQAEAEINTITRRIAAEDPSYADFGARLLPLREYVVGPVRPALLILLAAVCFLSLIACANVAGLLVARALRRRRELAVRMAVGASTWRMVRQSLTEGVLLSLLGGALGAILAWWSSDFVATLSLQELPRTAEIHLYRPVWGYTFAVTLLVGILISLQPCWQAAKADLTATIKAGSACAIGGFRPGIIWNSLVASQLALTLVLMIGAGLMINSFLRLLLLDPGFSPKDVIALRFDLPLSRYSEKPQQMAFFGELRERIAVLPGVQLVGMTRNLPLSGQSMVSPVIVEGRTPPSSGQQSTVEYIPVDAGYFQTMRIRMVRGRTFSAADHSESPRVAIVNETLARQLFPEEEAIGKRLRTFFGTPLMCEVVGVVGDIKHRGLAHVTPMQVFVPFEQNPEPSMTVVIKASGGPAGIIAGVRAAVFAIDRHQPIDAVSAMETLLSGSIAQPRFYTSLLGLFSAVALILASIGIYGVIAYSAGQRAREFGIRIALGAQRRDVLCLVIGQGIRLASVGIGVGVLGAFALTRMMSALLYGITSTDGPTFVSVTLVLTAVVLLACWLPARRVARIDPMVALRYE